MQKLGVTQGWRSHALRHRSNAARKRQSTPVRSTGAQVGRGRRSDVNREAVCSTRRESRADRPRKLGRLRSIDPPNEQWAVRSPFQTADPGGSRREMARFGFQPRRQNPCSGHRAETDPMWTGPMGRPLASNKSRPHSPPGQAGSRAGMPRVFVHGSASASSQWGNGSSPRLIRPSAPVKQRRLRIGQHRFPTAPL